MTILSFLIGACAGLWLGAEMQRRVRAERNLARLQRDVAEQDRDQALRGHVIAFDPTLRSMHKHPAGSRLPRQEQR